MAFNSASMWLKIRDSLVRFRLSERKGRETMKGNCSNKLVTGIISLMSFKSSITPCSVLNKKGKLNLHALRNRSFQQPGTFEYKTIRQNQRRYHSSRTLPSPLAHFMDPQLIFFLFLNKHNSKLDNWTFCSSLFSFPAVETAGLLC